MSADSDNAASVGTRPSIPPEFWPAMGKAMAAREWPAIPVSDFPAAAVKPNYWLCGMIDGHQKSVDGAMGELFAATHPLNFPKYRLLVVVYQVVTKPEIEALLLKHLGTRMDIQVIVAVIHRESGQFFPPHWTAGMGYAYPIYDPAVGSVVQDALREVLGPHKP